ncbi:hypothetical protein [Pseudorhodoferax soli]|uniref:Uncharacterized protein n=1 Tax=Pseudorhodoferax soli TaxID=545864 RepID=A0A368XUN4_9BURK|nr:hypothetical protein [Pseudorhodoferax soli]RCW71681.1 hypothetical protein DES41_104501 [Pseudorhodoferax soli]
MRFLAKSLATLLLAAAVILPLGVVGLLVLAWYCTDHQPSVVRLAVTTPADVARALRLAERNDPRRAPQGVLRTITLTQEELDLLLPQLAAHAARGQAVAELQDGRARVQLSLPLPSSPFGSWLNVQGQLVQTEGLPRVQALRLGRLEVPQPIADWLLARGMAWLQQNPGLGTAADAVQRVQITPQALSVVYAWHDGLPGPLQAALLPPEEVQRLRAQQQRLAQLVDAPQPQGVALHELLQPLLALAGERAGGTKATPEERAQEQRAALLVLAFYVNGKGLAAIAPAAADGPAPRPQRVQLAGRGDLAQHFSVSAALAAVAGTPLADAVGLYKELDDAGAGGSGFSFVDLAADRAGARLGALAVGPAAAQERLQRRVAAGLTEQDLLPSVRDLPEFLPQPMFQKRYGEPGSPAYKRMQADIERRIGALALYR